ncbi:MAG: deoxyguanosinetriphosphate triphosphohydrolase [Candidatus Improbicoccus devescovinae]|nr:MAG: deoxyguanosinetriphosphate triphosphohydrolase [Candidatus Improbicoccus devescovinae]
MNIRELSEKLEKKTFSRYATLSNKTKGREIKEELCDVCTVFQIDKDRIIRSKAFRRLKHKTQVFISPVGDHFTTRLIHSLEVSQIARTIARALKINEDLVEAISLGHDLGHSPFGHVGEDVLNKICAGGFDHAKQSVRIVKKLENNGLGLNLTLETIDGILNHSKKNIPNTCEGILVKICDKIAYINHDIDDIIRANKLKIEDIPKKFRDLAGICATKRINFFIRSIINSSKNGVIKMDNETQEAFDEVLNFMYTNVYFSDIIKTEETKVPYLIEALFKYFVENIQKLPKEFQKNIETEGKDRIICDYISGMTDEFAINIFKDIFIPKSFGIKILAN